MDGAALEAGSIRLGDGRRLAFAATGPADGFPVLYLHGAIGSPLHVSEGLKAALEETGVRWTCVQRPGFGGSDPAPGRTIPGFADDVCELAQALGARRLAVLGVSAGGPYALACGHALGDLVGAVAACSALSPLCAPHAVPGLPGHLRAPMRVIAAAPGPCTRVLDAALGLARRHPSLVLRGMSAGAAPADRLHLDGEGGSTAVGGLLAATAGGAGGLVEDYALACRPWGFSPEQVACEVHLWHGAQDRIVPVEHAWQLAAALPVCRAAFDPDEGHFFFRRRASEIVERLVRAARTPPVRRRVA